MASSIQPKTYTNSEVEHLLKKAARILFTMMRFSSFWIQLQIVLLLSLAVSVLSSGYDYTCNAKKSGSNYCRSYSFSGISSDHSGSHSYDHYDDDDYHHTYSSNDHHDDDRYYDDDYYNYDHYKGPECLDDTNIQIAVDQWIVNRTGAMIRFGPIEEWDVSHVTHMWNLFKDKRTFNDNIGAWNTACVTTMHGMFWGANAFNQPIGLWPTGNVENMHSMFDEAFSFDQDLLWDTSNVVDMTDMFERATSMQGDLSFLDVSNVFMMEGMFRESFYNQDLSSWDVSNVANMNYMFNGNPRFNTNIKHWDTKSLVTFERMFFNATSFDQKLCWDLPYQPIKSFGVFCNSEGKFDSHCVDHDVIYEADRKCKSSLTGYLDSFVDFFDEVVLAVEDFQAFFQLCFPFLPNITCFAPDAMTPVEHKGMVAMKDLKVGDRVLTASGDYQPVYSMFHSNPKKPTLYRQIHTSHSRNDTSARPLELTPSHMMQVVGYDNPIAAWQVEVGDYLYVMEPRTKGSGGNQSMSLATGHAHWKTSQVIEIQEIVRNGLYNPLTEDGTIVVDDIVTSAYVSFLGTEHIQLFREHSGASVVTSAQVHSLDDGWKVMSHQTFVHLLLSPYRAMCLYAPFPLCQGNEPVQQANAGRDEEREDSDLYGRIGQHVLLFWLKQNVFVQSIFFVVLVTVFGLLNMILSPTGLSAAMVCLGAMLCRKTSFYNTSQLPRKVQKEKSS